MPLINDYLRSGPLSSTGSFPLHFPVWVSCGSEADLRRALRRLFSRAYGSGFTCPYSRITRSPRSGVFSTFLCNVKSAQIKEKSADINQRIFGGGGWIRTTVGIASRFTVCPLWPLGNTPASSQASDRSLPAKAESLFPPLLLLFKSNPLRWASI